MPPLLVLLHVVVAKGVQEPVKPEGQVHPLESTRHFGPRGKEFSIEPFLEYSVSAAFDQQDTVPIRIMYCRDNLSQHAKGYPFKTPISGLISHIAPLTSLTFVKDLLV